MKSYFRFLSRNKLYTLINVAGLVISLMFIILIGDYTWRQYSIDSWHKHADQISLIGYQDIFYMWPQAAEEIKSMCPEIEKTCCVLSQNGRIKHGQAEVKNAENEHGIIMLTDSTFFSMFDFELTEGDRRTALDAPDKCVITERLAKSLFGDKNPIGESLQIIGDHNLMLGSEDPYDSTLVYTVSAVAKNLDHTVLPNETQLIASMQRYPQIMGFQLQNEYFAYTGNGTPKAFFQLHPGTSLDSKIKVIQDHLSKNYSSFVDHSKVSFTPLTDIMFAPQNKGMGLLKGDKMRLRILLAAVLAILFFAITNYINLTVANTGFRAKEMATRKLFGSNQHQISLKLVAESTLLVAISFAIGLVLALCIQDDIATLFKGKIDLINDISWGTLSVCLGFILLLGIISGVLPSWHISRFQPIDIVKGSFRFHSKMVLGKIFIILQNVVTVTMLTAALVIWLQLNHLIHAPLGFNTENIYSIYPPFDKSGEVRNMLEKMPFVEEIGALNGTSFTMYSNSMSTIKRDGKDIHIQRSMMNKKAFDILGLKIKKDFGATNGGVYLNEEAIRQLGYTEDTREIDWGRGEKSPICGILYDFHCVNVLKEVEPFAIIYLEEFREPSYYYLIAKTNGDKQALAAFQDMFRKMDIPEEQLNGYANSFDYYIAETFADQQNTLKIITLFTFVAVIISIMGFIGMSLFFIRQRQKEIGIRKIMGSTSHEVMMLMLRTFCAPLLVSFIIAIPLSWYIMHDWLTNFSYRIELKPWIFIITCIFALLVAVLSVGLQIIKAARTNPAESIKTE